MQNIDQNNTLIHDEETFEEYNFQYNFINMPWDERTRKSKISIVVLLVTIFLATMACVANSFIMHYKGIGPIRSKLTGNVMKELNCQLVRVEDYRYTARIHSLNTEELICVGAVVGENIVLANGACVKNRQVLIRVGRVSDPRCKMGFSIHTVETVVHEGVIAKKLVLLITNDKMLRCAKIIQFGTDTIHKQTRAYVIGRTLQDNAAKTLSRQPVQVAGLGNECSCQGLPQKQQPNIICVRTLSECPVLAGDLLVQGGLLYGLASTSLYRKDQLAHACFADLKIVLKDLKDFSVTQDYIS